MTYFIGRGSLGVLTGVWIIGLVVDAALYLLHLRVSPGVDIGLASALSVALALGLEAPSDLIGMAFHLSLIAAIGVGLARRINVDYLVMIGGLFFAVPFLPLISMIEFGIIDITEGDAPRPPVVIPRVPPRWTRILGRPAMFMFLGVGAVVGLGVVLVLGVGVRSLVSFVVLVLLAIVLSLLYRPVLRETDVDEADTQEAGDGQPTGEARPPAVTPVKAWRWTLVVALVGAIGTGAPVAVGLVARGPVAYLLLGLTVLAGGYAAVIGLVLTEEAMEELVRRSSR